jgi:O-antigen/teichoic acid export membrane protein
VTTSSTELRDAESPAVEPVRGVRAASIVAVGIATANVGNYLFHFVTARTLGPAQYADVATLVALAALISFPLAGIQYAVARYVAGFAGVGDDTSNAGLFRTSVAKGVTWGTILTIVFVGCSWPLQHLLNVQSLSAVVLTTLATAPAVLTPIVLGLVQGLQRFQLFAVSLAAGPCSRVILVSVLLAAGLGVSGAMAASLIAMVVGLIVPFVPARDWLRRGRGIGSPIAKGDAARYVVPVMIGVLSITALTTSDVIAAKVAFPKETAGLYGSASLIGRVILYLPAAIVMVLLPKVSARTAAGRQTIDVLARSLFVTAAFGIAAIAVYAVAPNLLVFIAFGSGFRQAAGYLWLFAIAMSTYAMLNVLLAYHLGRGVGRFSWILFAGAIVQPMLFVAFHDSPRQLLAVDIAVAVALLVLHELLIESTLLPATRELLRARRLHPARHL